MKLKNLMDTNAMKNYPRKVKQAKFADIGANLLNNKKKNQMASNLNQNSELIELTNNISTLGNKGIFA